MKNIKSQRQNYYSTPELLSSNIDHRGSAEKDETYALCMWTFSEKVNFRRFIAIQKQKGPKHPHLEDCN